MINKIKLKFTYVLNVSQQDKIKFTGVLNVSYKIKFKFITAFSTNVLLVALNECISQQDKIKFTDVLFSTSVNVT